MTDDTPEPVRKLVAREQPALEILLQDHLPGLRAFIRLRFGVALRAKESSCDLVQSVCREILEQADRFKYGEELGFKRWLYRTAVRKIADRVEYYHAQKRDVKREIAARMGSSDADVLSCYGSFCTPSRQASAREELLRVERSFDRLPERYREVILQARILGVSRAEIGAQMGCSQAAVRTLLSRAVARLAELLDD